MKEKLLLEIAKIYKKFEFDQPAGTSPEDLHHFIIKICSSRLPMYKINALLAIKPFTLDIEKYAEGFILHFKIKK